MIAPSMVECVRFAGGWLFDSVTAGWDVTVLTSDGVDSRALRILGARGIDLEMALASSVRTPRPRALAVDAGLLDSDETVLGRLLAVLDGEGMEIRVWGGRRAADPAEAPGSVHRLSSAARAFKTHALAAATVSAAARVPDPVRSGGDSGGRGAGHRPPAPHTPAAAVPAATEIFWSAESLRPVRTA